MKSLRVRLRRKRSEDLKVGTYICTEDNLPIRNISFNISSRKIREPLVVKHFARFGEIKQVKFQYGKTRSQPIRCTVCYKSPSATKQALTHSQHKLLRESVKVRPCPSWEQPFSEIERENEVTERVILKRTDRTSILTLNDYCLEIIYEKLDLRQQLRLSLCDERLESVFVRMICARKIKDFSLAHVSGFTLWEIRQLFKTAGHLMRRLEITRIECTSTMKHESAIYDFMREYCDDVRSIQIVRRRFIFTISLNDLNINNISELELYDCDLYEGELAHLRSLRNLSSLGLAHNRNIMGLNLCCLKKVQKLSLYACAKVSQSNLCEICQHLSLRYLDARCMDGVRNWGLIVEHCKDLETLKISRIDCDGREGAESIARLPKLKKLEMQLFVRAMPSSFYDTLVDHHAEDLEELKITGMIYALFPTVGANIARFKQLSVLWMGDNEYNSSKGLLECIESLSELRELNVNYSVRIKGDHLLSLLKHCHKLKHLGLRYCKNITNDFVFSAITVLQERPRMRGDVPLLILVGGTRVRKDILQDLRYQNAKHILRLAFHVAKCDEGYLKDKNEFLLVDDNYIEDDSENSTLFSHDNNDDYYLEDDNYYGDGDPEFDLAEIFA